MDPNYFSRDIKEFIRLLDKYDVKYVIVGGEAVIYYGYPRLTGDVDFFFSSDDKNVI
jgi:predicted nucleotidyltransferase